MIDRVMGNVSFSRTLLLFVAGAMTVIVPSVLGQASGAESGTTPPAATTEVKVPVFDVASVKPNKSDSGMMMIGARPDGFRASNVPLKMLLSQAYGIKTDLISGGPSWVDSALFDVEAKVADVDLEALKKLSPKQRLSMLQPVLADRFKLKVHIETKQLPVFELLAAKGGIKLKEAIPGATYANEIKAPDGTSIKMPEGGARAGMMKFQPGEIEAQGIPMTNFVSFLSGQIHRTVVDKTGLTGKYDITLKWTPEEGQASGLPGGGDASDSSAPSTIFGALQEQLGLRLQSSKGPVDTLVIDHVEMPSAN
jgi:uncharacterized protein (TIGR03435 family)